VELNPSNRKFTWSSNQVNLVLAKLDRFFASTEWECVFPLARVVALPKGISDHNPLLIDVGANVAFGKKARFKKWWLVRADFKDVVLKAWSAPCPQSDPMEVWQNKIRSLRKMVRGWANNVIAKLNKHKQAVVLSITG
jgi:hypothetical protein